MKMHCSLTICPHLVSLFLVGEKPVSFYAAFISVCISDISLVVWGIKGEKKTFFGCPQEKKRKRLSFRAAISLSYRIFFPENQHVHGMLAYQCFCKRECT